jgi:hypothetical protein
MTREEIVAERTRLAVMRLVEQEGPDLQIITNGDHARIAGLNVGGVVHGIQLAEALKDLPETIAAEATLSREAKREALDQVSAIGSSTARRVPRVLRKSSTLVRRLRLRLTAVPTVALVRVLFARRVERRTSGVLAQRRGVRPIVVIARFRLLFEGLP